MKPKSKKALPAVYRIDPPETWYYARRESVSIVPIDGVYAERYGVVITRDGIEFPKADIFPTERAAWLSIYRDLSTERGALIRRVSEIESAQKKVVKEIDNLKPEG